MKFEKFDKIPRMSRDIVITEKIDGTNAQVVIINRDNYFKEHYNSDMTRAWIDKIDKQFVYKNDEFFVLAGSRKKWLDISSNGDNFCFAKWVVANAEELIKLGEGRHYGEWYGKGIQRNYGLDEKRFALFNVGKWADHDEPIEVSDKRIYPPKCCGIVPVLYRGMFDTEMIGNTLMTLKENGSKIAPGFMNPEGIVIYHTASGRLFKKTIKDDEKPKEQVKKEKATSEKV